jgi:hypothetical protein
VVAEANQFEPRQRRQSIFRVKHTKGVSQGVHAGLHITPLKIIQRPELHKNRCLRHPEIHLATDANRKT